MPSSSNCPLKLLLLIIDDDDEKDCDDNDSFGGGGDDGDFESCWVCAGRNFLINTPPGGDMVMI